MAMRPKQDAEADRMRSIRPEGRGPGWAESGRMPPVSRHTSPAS